MKFVVTSYRLSSKEKRRFINELSFLSNDALDIVRGFASIEYILLRVGYVVYRCDGKPLFFRKKKGEKVYPTLFLPLMFKNIEIPSVITDVGAVKYILNGADVMVPGITQIRGELKKGDICLIREEKSFKVYAIGEALMNKDQILESKKGRAIKNIHYYNDKLWKIILTLLK
ncbi:MAG: RNA-binding protein [Thermoprotei archaeon]|mgnify:CR=1 FL=1|nr:MAG: RNA-binding protein [Thermoprotei archaeon]